MKKFLLPFTLAGAVAVAAACSDDETVENPESAPSIEENEEAQTNDTGDNPEAESTTISFREFEFDADYEGNDNDFEVSYDSEGNIEASYEDQRNQMLLSGDDAYQEIEPILSGFDFTADTPDDEVFQAVIDGFEIEEGYQSLEIDITFEDGTEKEYEQKP
ncbi:YusW family protein [Jeotgalibacillus proteolyticus]|uniref:YusW-like protein n=1 Tax=Jeotgalibacillus proteolyticus TaxID=2082395 RepID=A0A2S5GEZ6_9BACL|nr:YusW family protein [Jeotgalibacillus proteolyticus]PPA71600.1 hypothetical protein C4B60_05960 [Jeotgalibacillus proteolyticus]